MLTPNQKRSIASTMHGHAKDGQQSRTYKSWSEMRYRCQNKYNKAYPYYGGRGITVCKRWNIFINFLTDMGECPEGMSLDRIDNNGNYEPSNCKWSTRKQQQRNIRSNRTLTYKGITMCLSEWSEYLGISQNTLTSRLVNQGWPVEKAFSTPIQKNGSWSTKSTGLARKRNRKRLEGVEL